MNAAYQKLCARLMMAGVPDARFDAAQLHTFVTGRDHRLDDGPNAEEASRLQVLAERRAGREPLQYLLGEWDFLGFTLKVGRGVLCPRADSEVVCETAIELLKDSEAPVVYDLCAGTGCGHLAAAHARQHRGVAGAASALPDAMHQRDTLCCEKRFAHGGPPLSVCGAGDTRRPDTASTG